MSLNALHRLAAAPLVVATLAVAACTPEPAAPPTPSAGASANAAFCSAYLAANDAFMASPIAGDGAAASLDVATIKAEAEKLADAIAPAAANAPAEIQAAFDVVTSAIDKVVASGDATGFMDEAMMVETAGIDLWVYDNCGWAQVTVKGTDFAFEGIPDTLPPGTTAFKLENAAPEEFHVMLIVRREPGTTATIEEVLAYQGDGIMPGFTMLGAAAAAPGTAGVAVADLTPGDYLAICPIPQGGQPGGESHAALGMVSEFTVE